MELALKHLPVCQRLFCCTRFILFNYNNTITFNSESTTLANPIFEVQIYALMNRNKL